MKFLFKVAVIAAAAKFVVHTPSGTNPQLNRVSRTTIREMAHQVDSVFSRLQATIKSVLS